MARHSRGNNIRVVAFLLVFGFFAYSFTTLPVRHLVGDTANHVANVVGVFAGVQENQFNTLAQQLQQKESELDNREAALDQREAALANSGPSNRVMLLSFGFSSVLLLFLVLNFYFDWRRGRKSSAYSIQLKK